jgi:predicted transcriptional regulator
MAQVNISLEDRVVAELDRIAEAKSLSRPELLRRVIQELIEAHDAGRVLFQKEAAPRLDTTVSFLVHELRDLVVELDRAQNENARLFGKLVTDWNGGEAASQRAYESIANQIRQRNSEAYSAFYQQVEKLLAGFEALEPRLVAVLEPHLTQISEQLAESIRLAGEPRKITALYLSNDRVLSLKFLSACAALTIFIGALIATILPTWFDGWSVWQAAKLIDSDAQMCRLIEREYGTADCRVPERERDLGLAIIARENRK